jgi:hypothetical protein
MPIDDENRIYGTFNTYSVTTDANGEANLTYKAPESLDNLNSEYNVVFSSGDVKAYLSLNIQTINNTEDVNTSKTDYTITITQPDKFSVESDGSIIVNIVKQADENQYIDQNDVFDVNVSVTNNLLFFNEDKNITKQEYNQSSIKYIHAYTGKYSGIETLTVSAKIFDGEDNVTIYKEFPIVIESGPISSISINYVSSSYDDNTGLFEDIYSIHAVDKYSNPARAGSKIVVGAIVGKKIFSKTGKIQFNTATDRTEFSDSNNTITFTSVEQKDSVAIFADENRTDGSYLGGWIVDSKSSDDKTLYFSNEYNGSAIDALSYVIGNEKINNACTGGVAVADFNHKDGTYEIGEDGTTLLKLRYDRYLVGKTISIYANSYQDKRVGIAMKRILWGTGVSSNALVCDNSSGSSDINCSLRFTLTLKAGNGAFYLRNVTTGGYNIVCKNGNYKINGSDTTTDCSGQMELNISVTGGATCTANWNGSVVYEY